MFSRGFSGKVPGKAHALGGERNGFESEVLSQSLCQSSGQEENFGLTIRNPSSADLSRPSSLCSGSWFKYMSDVDHWGVCVRSLYEFCST